MQCKPLTAIALVFATSVAPACGTRAGFGVAGGTLLTGIVMSAALQHDNYNSESAFRPTDEIVGNLMVLAGVGMLLGNLVAAARQQPSEPKPRVRPIIEPQAFAAPSRQISKQLRILTDLALTAARESKCNDARDWAMRAAAIDVAYVEATLVNDTAMRRCAGAQVSGQ